MHERTIHGFTLIELLIVVAILGIMAMIAMPIYQSHLQKSRRADGKAALLEAAQRMERYYTENNKYTGAVVGTTFPSQSEDRYYTLAFTMAPDQNSYSIEATGQKGQAKDPDCSTMTIDQAGRKTPAKCW